MDIYVGRYKFMGLSVRIDDVCTWKSMQGLLGLDYFTRTEFEWMCKWVHNDGRSILRKVLRCTYMDDAIVVPVNGVYIAITEYDLGVIQSQVDFVKRQPNLRERVGLISPIAHYEEYNGFTSLNTSDVKHL